MATYATLTVDPDALLENREPASDVVVKITTNTGGVIFDTATGKAILANWSEKIAGGAATTFSLPTTDGSTNPTDFQYMIVLNYIDTVTRSRKDHWNSGWISFTADANLAGVVGGQYVPPTWMTTATATLQTYVDSGQAAATAAAASATSAAASASVASTLVTTDLGTTDGQTFALLTDVNSESAGAIEPIFNIRRFGAAVGNTAAANQAAIQNALDAAGVSGGTVYVPPGTFLHNDAFTIPSNVHVRGSGLFSILKATSLVNGGSGIGHRQLDATSKTGFRISDLMLDASEMTVFTSGMRTIWCSNSTKYSIERVHFRTPGAAVATVDCSEYVIDRPVVECISSDGVSHHDGVLDQWSNCHDFQIINPVVYGNGVGEVLILVTGEGVSGGAGACYGFTITNPMLFGAKGVGIWVNGRAGVNHTFTITNPLVDGVTDYHGIDISDARAFTISSPVVKNVGANGIRLYTETTQGGTVGVDDATISSPMIYNANTRSLPGGSDGAAIAILAGSNGVTLTGARVEGTAHTYAVYFDSTVTNCFHGGGSYDAGVTGKVFGDPAGGTYTPTVTAVANVSAGTSGTSFWTRDGDVITVRGRVTITPTAGASTATSAGLSLPVASDLANAGSDLFGTAANEYGHVAAIKADTVNNWAQINYPAPSTAAYTFYYTFAYRVL